MLEPLPPQVIADGEEAQRLEELAEAAWQRFTHETDPTRRAVLALEAAAARDAADDAYRIYQIGLDPFTLDHLAAG